MPAIDVDQLRKSYGDRAAVDGVSFHVDSGELVAILGTTARASPAFP